MSQSQLENHIEELKNIIPIAIGILCVSFCKYLERHRGREAFSWAKLLAGMFRDLVWGLTLMCGALWLSHGNHYCAMFVACVGVLRGYKWTAEIIDATICNHFGVERGKDEKK